MTLPRSRTPARFALASALSLAGAVLVAGCTQPGPITSHRTLVGGLKTNVVNLESENDELRKQVATYKSESRDFEDQLVQERAHGDDLATRLDNAKGLLGRTGGIDREVSSRSDLEPPSSSRSTFSDSDPIPPPRNARKSSRATRKPPAASIPSPVELDPPASTSSNEDRAWGPQSRLNADDQWLPIASGTGSTRVRR